MASSPRSRPAPSCLVPEHESCFQCCWALIYHTNTITIGAITKRPVVECAYKGTNRTCDACLTGHRSCEKVAELLEGDYFDMFALLRWADQILLQPTRVLVDNSYVWIPLWTDDDKRSILQTEIYFMRAFRGVEMDHRSEHGIDVGKTLREENGAAATYNGVVHERRAGLLRLRPAPVSHNACDIELWNNKQRLRLEYGDKNFFNWAHAKLAFVEEILRMVERKDGRLLPSYKRSLPSTTIVYS